MSSTFPPLPATNVAPFQIIYFEIFDQLKKYFARIRPKSGKIRQLETFSGISNYLKIRTELNERRKTIPMSPARQSFCTSVLLSGNITNNEDNMVINVKNEPSLGYLSNILHAASL